MSPERPLEVSEYEAGQRKYLTLLFSDLSDSTRLGARMEAEDYADMLKAVRNLFHEIIPRHGGRIARIQGDGALVIFGYPAAGESDGRSATEAALELHWAVSQLIVPSLNSTTGLLALHSGIHGGLVYLTSGDIERGRFDLVGDVPNTAARLAEIAPRGEIYVSEETLGPETHFFTTAKRAMATLRGKSSAIAVLSVLGKAPISSRFQASTLRGLVPFVGRSAEMQTLVQHLRLAAAGAPQCVTILGGPGLGKTRLTEELLRAVGARQFLILRGYCESNLSAEPLQPFLQMLRDICGIRPGMTALEAAGIAGKHLGTITKLSEIARFELMRALSLSPSNQSDRAPAVESRIAALRSLFDILAQDSPLMLVVDDLQWADDASLRMLEAVRTLHRPICLLIVSRVVDGDSPAAEPVTTIALEPLSLADAARSIEHQLPGIDPFAVAEIHRYSGGNPLFIDELCHAAAANPDRLPVENRIGGAAWLNALIESRVGRLPPVQLEIVRAAAVIGNVVPAWLLERVTGYGRDAPFVRALADQDFLFPAGQPGVMRFKHGITRDVIYGALGLHQRRAMHLVVANALVAHAGHAVSDDGYESLAYHYAAADLPIDAARFAELAGDKALAASALDYARAQYLAALTALDRIGPLSSRQAQLAWCSVAGKLGMACVFDPLGLAEGVELFQRGVRLARESGDAAAIARAEYWLGYISYAKGRAREAGRHCEASLELAIQIGDERLGAQVRATLGQIRASAGAYDDALPLLDEAVNSKRRNSHPGTSVAIGSAYTLARKGFTLGDQGFFDQAEECFEGSLRLLGDSVLPVGSSVRELICAVRLWQGRWEGALAMATEGTDIAMRCRSRYLLAMGRSFAACAQWMLKGEISALQTLRESTQWIETRGGAISTSLNYGWLVEVAVALGMPSEARHHAARLFNRSRALDRLGEAMGCRALARVATLKGNPGWAEHYMLRADKAARARTSPRELAVNQLCRAELAISCGSPAVGLTLLEPLDKAFETMKMQWHLHQARRLRVSI